MKFQSLSVVFILGVMGVARMATGMCLIKNTGEPRVYQYHCFLSNNYLAEVQTAPVDIPQIAFTTSKIEIVRNRSFSRLRNDLETLKINFCGTEEIEDYAFEGLFKLNSLDLSSNNLRVVKGIWFKGLSNLKRISLRYNDIKHIENSFYSTVPPLDKLDITANDLTCFPMPPLEIFKCKILHLRYNPFSWECVSLLMDWVEKTGTRYDDFGGGDWDSSSQLVLLCEDKLRKPHNQLKEDDLKKCAQKTVAELLPPGNNYTVKEVCQFLEKKPSPFLTCS